MALLGAVVNRVILPTLNRCEVCHKPEGECDQKIPHEYKRDASRPEWHGWHAARRGLGSNLYRLQVPEMVIQRILRHANVSTTATYYIKTAADDVKNAMAKLENNIRSRIGHQLDTKFGFHRSAHYGELMLSDRTCKAGGEGGIRTPGTGFSPYNGLANRRLQPLGHLSGEIHGGRQVFAFALYRNC